MKKGFTFTSLVLKRRSLKIGATLVMAALLLTGPASLFTRTLAQTDDVSAQAAGDLDTTFGTGGRVTTDFFGGADQASAVAVQADGKIVVAGFAEHPGSATDFAVVRYNDNGSLDTSFGVGGKNVTDFFGKADFGLALWLESDGKKVVGGQVGKSATDTDFGLVRYNADGSLDSNFGTGGKVSIDFSGQADSITTIVPQPDDKLIVAGFATSSTLGRQPALARINKNGSLDTSFGGGRIIISFAGTSLNSAQAKLSALESEPTIESAAQAALVTGVINRAAAVRPRHSAPH